jgi:hypothetical protein
MKSTPKTNTKLLLLFGLVCILYTTLQLCTVGDDVPIRFSAQQNVTAHFQNCTMLNNSTFHDHPRRVDEIAYEIALKYGKTDMDLRSLERFACYMAASGSNEFNSKPGSLAHVNPSIYFSDLTLTQNAAVAETLKSSRCPPERKRYKIAFLLLVHKDLAQIKELLHQMYSPDGMYIFHVDFDHPELEQQIREWIQTDELFVHCNAFVLSNSKRVLWGDISIVMAQLEGFFQALYLAEWDYIVNMSAYCFPLKSVDEMHSYLSSQKDKELWMRIHQPSYLDRFRLNYIMIPSSDWSETIQLWKSRRYPFGTRSPEYKSDQWMILSRTAIQELKDDPMAFDLLAWMEFMYIPDEFYFGTYFKSSQLANRIFPEDAWYLEFPMFSAHPREITIKDVNLFKDHHCFTRKVILKKEKELALWTRDHHLSK